MSKVIALYIGQIKPKGKWFLSRFEPNSCHNSCQFFAFYPTVNPHFGVKSAAFIADEEIK